MFAEHNELGIEIGGCFKGHAEGALAIGALLIIVLAGIWIWRRSVPSADRKPALHALGTQGGPLSKRRSPYRRVRRRDAVRAALRASTLGLKSRR
jgi:hypothetical protein